MTILLDTSMLAAFLNPRDDRHDDARKLMGRIVRGALGVPLSTEHVVAEGLTLLRKRPGDVAASRRFSALFFPSQELRAPIVLHATTRDEVERTVALHFRFYERGLSFTDCHLLLLATEMGAPIATFDKGFDGLATRVEK